MARNDMIKLRKGTAAEWAAADALGVAVAAGETVQVGDPTNGYTSVTGDGSRAVALLPRDGTSTYAPLTGVTTGYVERLIAQAYPPVASDIPTIAVTGPGGANPISGGVSYAYDTSSITKIGCYPVQVTQYGTDYYQNQISGETGSGARSWSFEFMTTASDIVMVFRAATSAPRLWASVDGRPITESAVTYTANISPGSKSYYRLTFGTETLRRVRISMRYADFGGITVPATKSIAAAPTTIAAKAAFIGDSWFGDVNSAAWPHTISAIVARTMAWEFFDCGVGGTGYVGGALPYGHATRTTPLYAVAPNYVIVQGSTNDNAQSPAAVGAAATALYGGIATNLPSAKIIVMGPQPVGSSYSTSSTLLANRNAVRTAALAAGNVLGFIDPIAGKWFSGSGNISTPTGDGNKDYFVGPDNLHPTRAGAYRYAYLACQEIVRLLDKAGLL